MQITFIWNDRERTATVTATESHAVPVWMVDFGNGYVYMFLHNGWNWSSCGKLGFRLTKRIGMELDKVVGLMRD